MIKTRKLIRRVARHLLMLSVIIAMLIAQRASLAQSPLKEAMDPIYLNHFFLTVDAETLNAIKASSFLKDEFATYEERTTVRTDTTYTAIYFYGTRTYFEFFEEGQGFGTTSGAGGIASGIEARGGSDRLKQRLEAMLNQRPLKLTITRKVGDKDVPWFYSMGGSFGDRDVLLTTWMMEYHGDFLNNWYGELSPTSRGITRAEILERYTAKLGDNERRKQKYLDDVIEMHLALDDKVRSQFVKEREAYGYRVTTGQGQTVCEGPGIKYIVAARTASSVGITAIKLSLRRAKTGEQVYRFGKRSVLRFNDDRTATWSF
jgi:hypothetical protein